MKLTGNTILITGATSGIGYVLATRFADLGNTVIAVGRNQDALTELATRSASIHPLVCDLGNPPDVEQLVVTVGHRFPALNVLINNAGIQYNYEFAEASEHLGRIAHEIAVNLTPQTFQRKQG